jgi:hypothetical protein
MPLRVCSEGQMWDKDPASIFQYRLIVRLHNKFKLDSTPLSITVHMLNAVREIIHFINWSKSVLTSLKGKAVPLHAMEALGGRGSIAPTHSRPRH